MAGLNKTPSKHGMDRSSPNREIPRQHEKSNGTEKTHDDSNRVIKDPGKPRFPARSSLSRWIDRDT
jgi:hypothetical protein